MTTSSPPPDEPIYRGTTVTPESPRPVHIPEPTNIPVLEKQTDPIFNLTATHMSAAPPLPAVPAVALSDGSAQPPAQEAPAVTAPMADASNAEGVQNAPEGVSIEKETATVATEVASLPQHEQSEMSLQTGPATGVSLEQAFDPSQPSAMNNDEPGATSLPEAQPSHPAASASESQPTNANQLSASDTANPDLATSTATEVVNYQTLIDQIIPSNATEPPHENEPAMPAAPAEDSDIPPPNAANLPLALAAPGLPPRPPPQEKPSIHPNYSASEDIRSFHFPNLTPSSATSPQNGTFPGSQPFPSPVAPAPGTSGIPPAPGTYPVTAHQNEAQGRESHQSRRAQNEAARRANVGGRHDNAPWGPDIQKMYDQFLDDEKVYTAEGTWDRFPKDSRLFVGNLPTEVVTKRDIFHIFHRYGRLAQISIKNAYGFVQFMDESACRTAMHSEQGKKIKEKSMHLEISKPPKNSRNAAVSAAGERLRASHYRRSRSRSPERRQGRNDRQNRGSGDHRDAFRRSRDDYRPNRSPSPGRRDSYRGGRDRSPDRYGGGRRDRSRSPYGRYRNRSPSPHRMYNDDDGVPLPRRNPRDVPEVQIVLVDPLDRRFVEFVQGAFHARSLSVAVLPMPSGVSLDAIVKRQIVEGVMAVVKLFNASQAAGKLPVQIFDRTGGVNRVRFEEYEGLEPHVAAELVVRSKQKQATAALNAQPQQYGTTLQQLGINMPAGPQQQQQPHQQVPSGQPNLANLITQLDGPALQKLLGAMQSPNTPQGPQQSPTHNLGFGPMMAAGPGAQQPSLNPGGHNPYGYPPQHLQQPQVPYGYQGGAPPHQHQQPPPQQQQQQATPYNYTQGGPPPNPNQVQDIMSQLAQWRR